MVDLRTQLAARRQPLERQLEQRIAAQAGRIVAVLVAGGDHQHPEADDVGERMHGAAGSTRIVDAGGEFEPALDLAQHQKPAAGRQPAAIEPGDGFLAGNR